MAFKTVYGPFPVKTIHAKVEWGALKSRDLVTHNIHLVTCDPNNTNEAISLSNKKMSF